MQLRSCCGSGLEGLVFGISTWCLDHRIWCLSSKGRITKYLIDKKQFQKTTQKEWCNFVDKLKIELKLPKDAKVEDIPKDELFKNTNPSVVGICANKMTTDLWGFAGDFFYVSIEYTWMVSTFISSAKRSSRIRRAGILETCRQEHCFGFHQEGGRRKTGNSEESHCAAGWYQRGTTWNGHQPRVARNQKWHNRNVSGPEPEDHLNRCHEAAQQTNLSMEGQQFSRIVSDGGHRWFEDCSTRHHWILSTEPYPDQGILIDVNFLYLCAGSGEDVAACRSCKRERDPNQHYSEADHLVEQLAPSLDLPNLTAFAYLLGWRGKYTKSKDSVGPELNSLIEYERRNRFCGEPSSQQFSTTLHLKMNVIDCQTRNGHLQRAIWTPCCCSTKRYRPAFPTRHRIRKQILSETVRYIQLR